MLIMNILKSNRFFVLEWLVFVKFGGFVIMMLSYNMLVQDKFCMQKYNQTMNFCQHINSIKDEEEIQIADDVLKDGSMFILYRSLVEFLPSFLWSLLVGSFLDRYASATRILLIMSCFGDFVTCLVGLLNIHYYQWSPYLMLMSSLQIWFTGGLSSFLTSIFRHIALTTEGKMQSIKYAFFEAGLILGLSSGSFIAGKLLTLNNLNAVRARTYERNYLVASALAIVSIGLVFGLKQIETVQEEQAEDKEKNKAETNEKIAVLKTADVNKKNLEEEVEPSRRTSSISVIIADEIGHIKDETKKIAAKLFSWQNVRATIVCLLRRRPKRARATILMLFFVQFIQLLTFLGFENSLLQFSEKAYHWDSATYTTFSAISKIGGTLFLTIWLAIFVKRFKVGDRKLILTGIVSAFLYQTTMGTFITPFAFMIAMPLGSFGGLISIAVRSMVAKIVHMDEIGKIFSLITTLETSLPVVSSLIYSNLFAASIDFHPGLIYQFSGLLFLITFLIYFWEEFYTQNLPEEEDEESHGQ